MSNDVWVQVPLSVLSNPVKVVWPDASFTGFFLKEVKKKFVKKKFVKKKFVGKKFIRKRPD